MFKLFSSLLILCFVLSSCGDASTSSISDAVSGLGSSSDFDNPHFVEKYNGYINFGNVFHQRAIDSYDRYVSWADPDKGPKVKRPYGLYTLYDHSIEALTKDIESSPDLGDLDELMAVVLEKASALEQLCTKVDGYYSREDYKDDDFAEGIAMHPQILGAFDAYFDAYANMQSQFVVLGDELFAHDLERYKDDGLLIHYNLMVNLHHAEKIIDAVYGLDGKDLEEVDLAMTDAAMAELRTSREALESLTADKEQVENEFPGYTSIGGSYLRETDEFIKTYRALKERIQESNFKYSISHPQIPAKGSPLKLSETYSDMVDEYNDMQ